MGERASRHARPRQRAAIGKRNESGKMDIGQQPKAGTQRPARKTTIIKMIYEDNYRKGEMKAVTLWKGVAALMPNKSAARRNMAWIQP